MLRTLGAFCISVSVAVFACSVEPPASTKPASDNASSDESLGVDSDELITPAACSVTLNFCDGAGAIGTDCTETGCTVAGAISACKSIVSQVGCTVKCNAVVRNSAGSIISTFRQQCGTTCCPEGSFCGAGNKCCNGTCQPGCPCASASGGEEEEVE